MNIPDKKTCTKCNEEKDRLMFTANARKSSSLVGLCKACKCKAELNRVRKDLPAHRASVRHRHHTNPLTQLLQHARERAKSRDTIYNLTRDDVQIPSRCPILNIPLFVNSGSICPNSPTIDRLIPELGYVPGNVYVISHRANTIKNNATAEEHEKIAKWMREHGAK